MAVDGESTWDRLRAVRRSGRLRNMGELEAKVYMVLLEHSSSATGLVRLSAERIALGEPEWPLGGVCTNVSRVRKALADLVALGAIELVEHGGGRGSVSQYRMLLPELMPLFDPDRGERGTRPVPDSAAANGDTLRPKGGHLASVKGDAHRPERGTPAVPRISNTQKPPPPLLLERGTGSVPVSLNGAKAGQEEEEEIFAVLLKRGLRRDTARRFARAVPRAELEAIWKEVVSDKGVKRRESVYFSRLREFLEAPELLPKERS